MLLTADIGNTNTAIGLYEGDKLTSHWRLTTVPTRTADELEIWLRNLLELEQLTGDDVTGVAISSVVPAITSVFREVAGEITSGDANRVGYCQAPVTPGHEFVGEVVALGDGAGEKYGADEVR